MTTRRAAAAFLLSLAFAGAALAAPGGFTITTAVRKCTNGTPSVSVGWTASAGATSYSIIRDGSMIATTTSTTYEDPAVDSGQSYTYSVLASDGNGDRVTFTLLLPPSCPTTVAWQFGNGALGTGTSASTTYSALGFFNWTVIVNGSGGSSCRQQRHDRSRAAATSDAQTRRAPLIT